MTAGKAGRKKEQNMAHYGFGPDAMKKLRVCENCGTASIKKEKFCVDCGRRLPDKTLYDLYIERHRLCSGCGAILTDEMEFCPRCGAKT